jgi:hypothetical protein
VVIKMSFDRDLDYHIEQHEKECDHEFEVVYTTQYTPRWIQITYRCKECEEIDYYEGYPTKERIAKVSKEKIFNENQM